jgi:hypothetical protein
LLVSFNARDPCQVGVGITNVSLTSGLPQQARVVESNSEYAIIELLFMRQQEPHSMQLRSFDRRESPPMKTIYVLTGIVAAGFWFWRLQRSGQSAVADEAEGDGPAAGGADDDSTDV